VIDYLRLLRVGDWIRFYPFVPLAGAILAGAEASMLLVIWCIVH
jgi:hypothetical protein